MTAVTIWPDSSDKVTAYRQDLIDYWDTLGLIGGAQLRGDLVNNI